jgi:predicted dehydrogenase (TIGR03970 family)
LAITLDSDVVIVGAGSAGSVVAEQLSADSNCRVTVLEAGIGLTDPGLRARTANGAQMPIEAGSPLARRYRADLTSSPVDRVTIVRGATVGGSGAVNGGYFCRGLPRDFDDPRLPGWAWPDVLDHFRAIETDQDFHNPAHGANGPIPVRRTHEINGTTAAFAESVERCGFSWIADLNDVDAGPEMPAGIGAVPLNIVSGVRTGPGSGYLMPALNRSNLTLLTQTAATRLRISSGRVVGIDAVGPDGPITVKSNWIVLCAGAIESAHLLMLSGVGDEAVLRSAGVKTVASLPVGARCADHPEWLLPVDWPAATGTPALEVVLTTNDDIEIRPYTAGFGAMMGESGTGEADLPHVGVALMKPRARGRITLVSADPWVAPRIEHRYDSEPEDVSALRRGAELARELTGSIHRGPPVWATSQHLCGSAPMGTEHDEWAVVDGRCRVFGVEGLWVADGSVLPTITSRGPHATIVMLGHRAAEFIRAG